METMTDEIKCPVCSSDIYEVRTGLDGERATAVQCQDCGHETTIGYAISRLLRKKREASGGSFP